MSCTLISAHSPGETDGEENEAVRSAAFITQEACVALAHRSQ